MNQDKAMLFNLVDKTKIDAKKSGHIKANKLTLLGLKKKNIKIIKRALKKRKNLDQKVVQNDSPSNPRNDRPSNIIDGVLTNVQTVPGKRIEPSPDKSIQRENRHFNKDFKRPSNQEHSQRHNPINNDLRSHSTNPPFYSSLFGHNPDIPIINLSKVEEKNETVLTKNVYSDSTYLHPHLIKVLKDRLGVTEMTQIQTLSVPSLIEKRRDCLLKSVTGSGKTLSYAIPIVQTLQAYDPKISRTDGVKALIIVPTRELAVQSYECFSLLCKSFTWIVPGMIIGGEKKKSEKSRIRKGINILVSTPGRLIDHIEHTANMNLGFLRWLVIDEADRLYEQGYEENMEKIVKTILSACFRRPQTVLLSATLTKGVEKLAGISLEDPEVIDASNLSLENTHILPQQLKQRFIVVPSKLRLIILSGFIISECSKNGHKALIFMSTQDVVDFHFTLFSNTLAPLIKESDLTEVGFFKLHGSMEQSARLKVFNEFRKAKSGILLCTDVASRGLDLPKVDWILQYSCAPTSEDYVHRVGRTARIGEKGSSLQFLLPSETNFLNELQKHVQANMEQIVLEEYINAIKLIKFNDAHRIRTQNPQESASHLHSLLEDKVNEDEDLLNLAKKAFLSHSRAYASYPIAAKEILPFKELHLGHLAKSFCLRDPPSKIGLNGYKFVMSKYLDDRRRPSKRNYPNEMKVSEFSSGLNDQRQLKRVKSDSNNQFKRFKSDPRKKTRMKSDSNSFKQYQMNKSKR